MNGTMCSRVQIDRPDLGRDEPRLLLRARAGSLPRAARPARFRRPALPRPSSRRELEAARAGSGRPGRARPPGPQSGSAARSRAGAHELVQGDEPPQPLLPGDGGVRGGGRGQDEQRRLAEPARSAARARAARETAPGMPPCRRRRSRRGQLAGERLEPLRAPREVARAEVPRARRRAIGSVRDADPQRQQVELLRRARRDAA